MSHFLYGNSHCVDVVGAVVGCGSVVEHFSLCGVCVYVYTYVYLHACMGGYQRITSDFRG